jgi:MSHA biogenesis protein MshN
MSLINQMLQDLEKRHASGAERGALPNQVRALPHGDKSSTPWWLLGIAATVMLIALVAWQFNNQPAPSPPAPVAIIAPPKPPPAAVPQSASAPAETPPPVPPSAEPKPTTASAKPAALAAKRVEAGAKVKTKALAPTPVGMPPSSVPRLALDLELETVHPTHAKSVALSSAKPNPVMANTKPPAPAATGVEAGATARAQAALADPQIDKRSQQLTPQQLAENEYRNAANLLNQGRLDAAQEGFRLALQHDPGHTGARQGLFGLLLEAKKNGEAEQVLQDGLKLNPNQPGFAMALARLQVDRSDTASAVETMQKSAPAALGSPDYLAFLAGLLQRQSRHREAIDYYQAALRLAPGSGVWLMGLGISLQALNRNSEAQDAFHRAKATNTLNPELQAFVDQRLRQLH